MAKVSDYFQAPVYCVRATDDLPHARHEMLRRDVRKLVVLDDGDEVAGLLSTTDLVENGSNLGTSTPNRIRLKEGLVRDVMTRNPFTINVDDEARTALRTLARRDVSGAPVMDDGTLAGIVTVHDLLPVLGDQAGHNLRVQDVMDADVVRVHRHDSVAHVVHAVLEAGARAAVVTEAESGVTRVGVITLESIIFDNVMEPGIAREKRVKSTRKRDYGGRKDARHVDVVHAVAEDGMWEDHPVIRPDASVKTAINVFQHEDVDALPVVEDEAVVGMLSKKDLARAITRVPA